MPSSCAGMVVNAAMASVGLSPRRMAWRMRSWISVGFERPWAVKEKTTPASRKRAGLDGASSHVIKSRNDNESASSAFRTTGASGKSTGNTNSLPMATMSSSRRNSLPEPSMTTSNSNSSARAWARAVFTSSLVSNSTDCRAERMGAKATMASDCGGRGPAVLRVIQRSCAAWWWVASIKVCRARAIDPINETG